ncbi:MAG: hypothetical protein IJI57_04545 [Flexilinea sp.]|nr:hypothetical protein [Flexilinea sp.]
MEPLKLIYDGYEIEIRSGGESMPIVTMRKMVTNLPEKDTIRLPKTILPADWAKTAPSWWEQPPMWWYNPTVTSEPDGNTVVGSQTGKPYVGYHYGKTDVVKCTITGEKDD